MPASNKESNVCSIPKHCHPSIFNYYRPIPLLNSEDKLFERVIFKHQFNHLQNNHLLSAFQSGFIPGGSCINQLTFLYNTFCKAIGAGKEVRAVFCDISKAFDRVWHAGLIGHWLDMVYLPPRGNFVDHIFLEAQCLERILQHVSPLTMAALRCNSLLHTLPCKIFDN